MNKKTLTLLLLASITLLSVAGVKVSKLTRTKSFASNDLFIVVTGSTTKVTRHIRAQDLAVGLGPWITNSGGGASSVTNAISVVRSNGTAISAAATSLDFIEGTNVTLRATNAAGVVTVQINASGGGSVDPTNAVLANIIGTGAITNLNASQFSGTTVTSIKSGSLQTNNLFYGDLTSVGDAFFQNVVRMSNNVIISGDLSLPNYVNVADTLDAVASKQHGSFILTNFIAMGITNIVSANGNTVITTNSGVLTLTTSSSGGSLATNANQFGASLTLTIKDGALLTNTSIRTALTLPTLTVSRAALVNSSGQITNSAAVSDVELEYLDGVTSLIQGQLDTKPSTTVLNTASNAIVALSSIGVTNYMLLNADRMIITNTLDRIEWSMGVNTNGVIPWGATNTIVYTPSNTFTITMSGTPPSGLARELNVLLINTNSTAGYFPTNDLNGGTIYMLPAPSTNRYKFNWRGGRFWISSGQQSETGTNSYMRTRTGVYRTIEVPAPAYSTNATNWSATFVSGGTNQGLGPKDFWLFSETATNEIHFGFSLPLTWDASALVARFLFATTNTIATQTNVFSISARTVTGADYDGGTYGTAQIIKTKTTTGKEITWTTATPNLTPSGTPAAGAFTEFKVTRIPGHADDNMQGLLRLYSVQLQYKESIVEPTALP